MNTADLHLEYERQRRNDLIRRAQRPVAFERIDGARPLERRASRRGHWQRRSLGRTHALPHA